MTHYLYDLSGRLIAEHGGKKGAVQAEYVAFNGIKLAFIATGSIYFVHNDHLGAAAKLTDDTKAVVWDADYRPFGEATVTGALAFNLRFPGQYYDDETGLHYNYFRDYDNATGRYLESDPIGLAGGWNTYAYVGGNPVMRVDPEGLISFKIEVPTVNGGNGACRVMYNATCVDTCVRQFKEDEEWRLDKLLSGLTDCRTKKLKMRNIVTCEWGVITFDWGLERFNRKKYEKCLKKCGSA